MNAELQTKVQASPAQNFTPVQTGLLQKKCALCNTPGLVEDSERDKEKLTLQRKPVDQAEPSAVPPIVHKELSPPGQFHHPAAHDHTESRFGHNFSRMQLYTDRLKTKAKSVQSASKIMHMFSHHEVPSLDPHAGQPIPNSMREDAEKRLHRPLDHILLHDDQKGNWTALSFGARAVTIGHHIYLAPGQMNNKGKSLLMHELAHAVSQDASLGMQNEIPSRTHPVEQAACNIAAGQNSFLPRIPVGIYRDPMSRTDFEQQMQRFGVRRIFTATFEQQVERLNYFGGGNRPGDQLQRSSWTAWDPGGDSSVYDWIMTAFTAFANRLGGVPAVGEIGFYAMDYDLDNTGTLVRRPTVAASYGGGIMAIFQSAVNRATSMTLSEGRSISGTAALRPMTSEQGFERAIAHELGHGLVETALTPSSEGSAPSPEFMNEYYLAAGWKNSSTPQLFDIGVREVQEALESRRNPPARYRITQTNWNDPGWIEQPLSQYMTTHPSEDLPVAVAVYVNQPDLLRQRSPRRFAFIESHKSALLPYLRRDLATIQLIPTETQLRAIGLITPPWMPSTNVESQTVERSRIGISHGSLVIRF